MPENLLELFHQIPKFHQTKLANKTFIKLPNSTSAFIRYISSHLLIQLVLKKIKLNIVTELKKSVREFGVLNSCTYCTACSAALPFSHPACWQLTSRSFFVILHFSDTRGSWNFFFHILKTYPASVNKPSSPHTALQRQNTATTLTLKQSKKRV